MTTTGRQPFEKHTEEDFSRYSLQELLTKRILVNICIGVAKGELKTDDRATKVLEYYRSERKAINSAILTKRLGLNQPPGQEVSMRQISMIGSTKKA